MFARFRLNRSTAAVAAIILSTNQKANHTESYDEMPLFGMNGDGENYEWNGKKRWPHSRKNSLYYYLLCNWFFFVCSSNTDSTGIDSDVEFRNSQHVPKSWIIIEKEVENWTFSTGISGRFCTGPMEQKQNENQFFKSMNENPKENKFFTIYLF